MYEVSPEGWLIAVCLFVIFFGWVAAIINED